MEDEGPEMATLWPSTIGEAEEKSEVLVVMGC